MTSQFLRLGRASLPLTPTRSGIGKFVPIPSIVDARHGRG
jgi:hypothetical protein